MGDWAERIVREVEQRVHNKMDQLLEDRIQHLRGRIHDEGATVEITNDPMNKQVKVHFDNISDELKGEVLDAMHGR